MGGERLQFEIQMLKNQLILQIKNIFSIVREMEKDIKFKTQKQMEEYASKNNAVLMIFDGYVLDATSFSKHHPGGAGLILNYSSKDITKQMSAHHPLSLIMANSMVVGTFEKQIKRLISPDQALLPQIWNMDHQSYLKIIDSPSWLFVNSPRMFQTDFFEMFSHNKWYNIFILPIVVGTHYFLQLDWTGCNVFKLIPYLLFGIFTFSLAEYLIHRFIFHSERHLPNSKVMRYLHFIMHGIHHMLPVDPDRIVYPPALAFFTMILGYFTLYQIIRFSDPLVNFSFWIGFVIGYLIYDLTHYSLHHIDTSKSKGSYFHNLQKYHNQHHFGGEQLGFGVSSKFWDIIFRTEMTKRVVH